jgi:hypothetical protein
MAQRLVHRPDALVAHRRIRSRRQDSAKSAHRRAFYPLFTGRGGAAIGVA